MPKYYTQFEDEYGLEVILENTDQEHPTIINRDAYRMFVARLIHINNKYYDRYADKTDPEYAKNRLVNYKTPFDIDIFYRMNHRWLSLAQRYYKTKDDPTGLKNISEKDKVHSFEPKHFDLIKQAATELFYDLSNIAQKNKFGTPYTDKNGNEEMDYTEVVDDILELSLLATHAYTDIFNVLENEKNFGRADEKMKELAYCMHNSHYSDKAHLTVKSWISGASKRLLDNPNSALKTFFPGYSDEYYLNRKLDPRFSPFKTETKKRTPEEEAKYQEEMAQLVKEAKEAERKKQEAIEKEIREEGERLAAEEEARRKAQSEEERVASLLARYADETKAVTFVPNEDNPSKINQAMYAYFDKFAERMGIDQSKFNAQSLIQASSIAFLTEYTRNIVEEGEPDIENKFLKDMVEIYKNVSHLTYDAYIQKCLKENTPIDLNVPSKEVLDLMGVAMYTMYPNVVNGEKRDDGIARNIAKVVNGYFASGAIKYDKFMRDDAIERAKLDYINTKDDAFFTADAEARFEGFATRKISSNNIVSETASIVDRYNAYKKNRVDPSITHNNRTVFGEANLKKEAMDAAYALERRVETRYGTRLARFFRYFSYAKQRDELARVKGILGIPKDQRVAEYMKSSRINDLFVEANAKTVKELSDDRQKLVGNNPIEYLNKLLENNLSKENMPKITNQDMKEEEYNRVHKYEELTPAAIQRMKEAEEERRVQEEIRIENERKLKEEEERRRKEEEEKERIRKEEEERKRKEEEERLRKEEEERQRKEEERKRKEEEERIRKEEEKKAYIRQQLADRAEAIQQHQDTLNEREVREYNTQLEILQNNKNYADKEYNEKKQIDDENREKFRNELDESIKRAEYLRDQIEIQSEQAEAEISQYLKVQHETEERYNARLKEIYANKKDKTLQKLLADKAKEDQENETKQWSVARQHTAGQALQNYLSADTTLQLASLQFQAIDKQIQEARAPIAEMEFELSKLEARIPELEKDLKRINHELEVATTVKKYVDNAIKYYTDNKEEIMSKYASEEIGRQLNMEIPYGKVEFYTTPIYETKVSDLQLEESDPEPMKTYIENYDKTMHITEEMKTMVL